MQKFCTHTVAKSFTQQGSIQDCMFLKFNFPTFSDKNLIPKMKTPKHRDEKAIDGNEENSNGVRWGLFGCF